MALQQPETKELATYKSQNIQELFAELKFPDEKDRETTALDIPYQEDIIKFPTLLSSSFFTLHTNKSKSDEVPIKLMTHNGKINGTLIRGRLERGTVKKGILTAFDGRVFLAVIHLWQSKGHRTAVFKDHGHEHVCGVVTLNISELVRKLYPNLIFASRQEKIDLTF